MQLQQAAAAAVAGASDARDAYRRALQAIATELGWSFGSVWQPDGDEGLRCVAIWHAEGRALGEFAALTSELCLQPGEGLPGRVWDDGHPVWISDFATEESLPRHLAAQRAGLHAAACFPLRSERGLVAALELVGDRPLDPDAELLHTFELLGLQLGQLVERRRAEDAEHAAQQRHRATLDAALDSVVTMDHRGRVVEFNPAAERTFGYPREEAIGRDMAELIVPPELRASHRSGLARLLAGAEARVLDRRIEIDGMRADGSRFPVELTITRIDVPGPATFTGHIRDITDRKLAEIELKASRMRIVEAGDMARRRIERDLHDGAQQLLVSATMNLRTARERVQRDPADAAALLDEVAEDLGTAIDELRELARGIHPAVLTDGGLEPALRGLVQRSSVPAALCATPDSRLPPQVEATAYFVVAETLTNAARHAKPNLVEIEVTAGDGMLRVEVRDDGAGGADVRGGGLRGLADRVTALGGRLNVISPPGGGTKICAELPCEPLASIQCVF
jgi:PAS domain S-box-containing protein